MTDAPKKHPTEPTLVVPRSILPPPATPRPVEIREAVTMLPCPACSDCKGCGGSHEVNCPTCGYGRADCRDCAACSWCFGAHLVTPAKCAMWEAQR